MFNYDELMQRDKVSLAMFWLNDESLEDAVNLADPDMTTEQMIGDLRAALEELESVQTDISTVVSD